MKKFKRTVMFLLALCMLCAVAIPAGAVDKRANSDSQLLELPLHEVPIINEDLLQLSIEQPALDAYQSLMDRFSENSMGIIEYPDDYGGAYYEDGYLYINVLGAPASNNLLYYTDSNNSNKIRYNEVKYSYNNLLSLAEEISRLQIESVTSVYVDMYTNQVRVGINANSLLADSELEAFRNIESSIISSIDKLGYSWLKNVDNLPIFFDKEMPSGTFGTITPYGGSGIWCVPVEFSGSICISGLWDNKPAFLTAGHVIEKNAYYTFGNNPGGPSIGVGSFITI